MKQSTFDVRVNVNTASEAELATLKDVGAQKAKSIIEYRRRHGAFKSLKQLEEVPGINRAAAEKLKGQLSVRSSGGERPLSERPPATLSSQIHAGDRK